MNTRTALPRRRWPGAADAPAARRRWRPAATKRRRGRPQRRRPHQPQVWSGRWWDRGSATVELVIATPLLTLLLLLVVQFGVWAHAGHIAQAAANQALQTARAYGSSAAAGDADAREFLDQAAGSILTDRTVTVTRTATTTTVTVTGTAATVVPGLRLPVSVTVTGPVERVVAKARGFASSEAPGVPNREHTRPDYIDVDEAGETDAAGT